jgi:hypothetical protein
MTKSKDMKRLTYVVYIFSDGTHKTVSAGSWKIFLDWVVGQWVLYLMIIFSPLFYLLYTKLK